MMVDPKFRAIESETGYPFSVLLERYIEIVRELYVTDGHDDPLDVLESRARAKAWGDPATIGMSVESTEVKESVDSAKAFKSDRAIVGDYGRELVILPPRKQYICDPEANKSCNRQGCSLKGGSCFTTDNRDYAASDERDLPMEATPRRMLEFKALHGQITISKEIPKISSELQQLRTNMHKQDRADALNYAYMRLSRNGTNIPPESYTVCGHEDHMRMHPMRTDDIKTLWRVENNHLRATVEPSVTLHDAETTKLLKHSNDTMWHMIAGAGIVLSTVAVGALIVLGILAFARGI